MLIQDMLDFHTFDWYHNLFTMGTFSQFTSGQFSILYADILQRAGRYRNFHFAGELASHHHVWVAGALDSAARVACHIEMDQRSSGQGQDRSRLAEELGFRLSGGCGQLAPLWSGGGGVRLSLLCKM